MKARAHCNGPDSVSVIYTAVYCGSSDAAGWLSAWAIDMMNYLVVMR